MRSTIAQRAAFGAALVVAVFLVWLALFWGAPTMVVCGLLILLGAVLAGAYVRR